jgi:hypothetical protein
MIVGEEHFYFVHRNSGRLIACQLEAKVMATFASAGAESVSPGSGI